MKSILLIGIGIVFVILSILHKNDKVLTLILYVYMWMIYTFCNSGNPDLDIYTWTYNNYIYTTSYGFDIAMKMFATLGLPFVVFKGACGIFTLYFYRKTFKLFFKKENTVLALCIIYPFLASISQIRNGMMAAFVLYAICDFIISPKKESWLYILRIVFVGILLHPAGFIYLIVLFARNKYKNNTITICLTIVLIILVELVIVKNLAYNIFSKFITNQKYLNWFDFKSIIENNTDEILNIKGKLLPMVEQIVGVFSVMVLSTFYMEQNLYNNKNSIMLNKIFNGAQIKTIKNIYILLLFMLPLYQMSPTYFRIFMNLMPIIYILIVQIVSRNITHKNSLISLSFICIMIYALVMTYFAELGYTISMFESFSIH